MARYVHVDSADGDEFDIGVTHPDDPKAAPGQYLRPNPDEPQTITAEELRGYEDALQLKLGWYDLDNNRYVGRDRPAE